MNGERGGERKSRRGREAKIEAVATGTMFGVLASSLSRMLVPTEYSRGPNQITNPTWGRPPVSNRF